MAARGTLRSLPGCGAALANGSAALPSPPRKSRLQQDDSQWKDVLVAVHYGVCSSPATVKPGSQ